MSITESQYGERFFEFDRGVMKQLDRENGKRQYDILVSEGEIKEGLSFEDWYNQEGNYDPNDWG